jgi:SAM-dependent methyltransferase
VSVSGSLAPDYFDAKYAEELDPWSFETSPYEAAKYQATLNALPRPRYENAFEIGCSIGVLTEQLAERCDRLLAVDVAERALERARERCAHLPHVLIERQRVPAWFPDASFDLIVVSEVGYYWSRLELGRAYHQFISHLAPGGHLLLVHWTPYVEDYPLTGDEVHDALISAGTHTLRRLVSCREARYRLNLLERVGNGNSTA